MAEPFSAYQKFIVLLLTLLQFTIVLDFMILSPLSDTLKKSLLIDNEQFASVVAAYAISAAISGFLAAGFADKFDRKKLLMFFYTGFIGGTLYCGLANSYEALYSARIITGIFGGVIGSISMAIMTDVFSVQQRGRVMGTVQMGFAGSQILGIPIGLWIAKQYDWHATFIMVVVLAVILGLAIIIKLKPINEHLKLQTTKNPYQHLLATIKKKNYRVGFMATAMLSMGGFMLMPFTSVFLINNVKISEDSLPVIFFCTGISSVIIMPIIGKLSDRIDRFKLFTIGSVVAMVMIVVYTNLTPVPVWVVILVNMILFMGIMSRMVPAVALNSAVPDMSDRGAYMSVNSSLQQMAGGVAAKFGGWVLIQKSESSPYENFYVLGFVMVGLMLWCIYLVNRVSKVVALKNSSVSV
ncbi:MAG: MFS transporter [Bacteroidia bacterium]|nr:MFS transporter [Bacteroidia bacterium]